MTAAVASHISVDAIHATAAYINAAIDLLPVDYYFAQQLTAAKHAQHEDENGNPKRPTSYSQQHHQQHRKANTQSPADNIHTATLDLLRTTALNDFDADVIDRTVTNVQEKLNALQPPKQNGTHLQKRRREEEESDDEEEDDDDADEEADTEQTAASSSSMLNGLTANHAPGNASLDELRARLHSKIADLQPKRKIATDADPSTLTPRQLKRNRKKANKEEAKRKRNKPSKLKDQQPQQPTNGDVTVTSSISGGNKQQQAATTNGTAPTHTTSKQPTTSNDTDFTFPTLRVEEKQPTSSYALQGELQRSNHHDKRHNSDKAILQRIERFENQVNELRAAGKSDEADKLVHDHKLNAAMLRASGVAVKDDKKLLNKSIKRTEREREKSKLQWKARKKEALSSEREKQQQKADRIEKRMSSSKSGKKSKIGSASGLIGAGKPKADSKITSRPGFSNGGKFIN